MAEKTVIVGEANAPGAECRAGAQALSAALSDLVRLLARQAARDCFHARIAKDNTDER
jgi:hypothetical protein